MKSVNLLALALASVTVVATVSAPALADDRTVNYAYALCSVVDNTGLGSSPCEVSGWGQSVTATLDMDSGEARNLCVQIAGLMASKGAHFDKGWTFQIKSPYSNGNSIAYCHLPQ
ncbi:MULTISPECIES: hypothetical protein [unclassified Mesorhizobium]|uniref:hypothetical protein n=1 Tax=unclassified Mesorhizobium TaxID=325217 RepID=UPI00112C23FA|nr:MULTISPECIES: hypothetical protein [unclassified Mesorhizobium]MCA0000918.1 hypothetical protein [Mesorhizobium sp. B264B2A]MCA0004667.1 hypothetical protein [Mesorhizobium sp. B264B1B]MCA0019134.1 hypothetical protein [Mesorhizobium sp. B264B1A]TPJ44610.1 hypothetical protein FJ437_19295 [Mesorhizobium sp. B2-6-6]